MISLPESQPTLDVGNGAVLRPLRTDDTQRIWEQCQDPEMIAGTLIPNPYGHADAETFVADAGKCWHDGSEAVFAIDDGAGFCGSVALLFHGGDALIGYSLHPDARGGGLASRSVLRLLHWGFRSLGLDVIHWDAILGNRASLNVAQRCGIRVDGIVRDYREQRGVRVDCWVGSVCRADVIPGLGLTSSRP